MTDALPCTCDFRPLQPIFACFFCLLLCSTFPLSHFHTFYFTRDLAAQATITQSKFGIYARR